MNLARLQTAVSRLYSRLGELGLRREAGDLRLEHGEPVELVVLGVHVRRAELRLDGLERAAVEVAAVGLCDLPPARRTAKIEHYKEYTRS